MPDGTKVKAEGLNEDQIGDGSSIIAHSEPYRVSVTIEGTADILFHKWDSDEVELKARAAKNSAAKKDNNPENCVYRNKAGELCVTGAYLKGSIREAARYIADPRSPRKSARDLYTAAVIPLEKLVSFGVKDWDYLDRQRALVQRNAITRVRPALLEGWRLTALLQCNVPDLVSPRQLNEVIAKAGLLVGIADGRPTFGRFNVVNFEVLKD